MEELEKTLLNLDFTKGEAKVYLSLLKLGESKVGPIIQKSYISRSKVYDILERLFTKGVISRVESRGIMFYQALPPSSLLTIIKRKEEQLKQEELLLKSILPQFSKILPDKKLQVVMYQGYEGFKSMIDQTIQELTSKDIYEAMGISKTTEGMRHYARKIYENQKNKKFKARSIFDEGGVFKAVERESPSHEMRVLPKGWKTPALFTIYGETVGIHLGQDENIISLVIKYKDIAQSFRITFEAMWVISKEVSS